MKKPLKYEALLKGWTSELEQIERDAKELKIPFFFVKNEPDQTALMISKFNNFGSSHEDTKFELRGISNLPEVICVYAKKNDLDEYEHTVQYVELEKSWGESAKNLMSDIVSDLSKNFYLTKGEVVGFKVFLNYASVTLCYDIGYSWLYERHPDAELSHVDSYIDDELTAEEIKEQEEYDAEMKIKRERILLLSRELSTDRRLAVTRNRDQRLAVAKLFFGDRIKAIDDYELETIATDAINIFEIEMLPKLVKDLTDQGKTPKQVSDELGISLAKAKKFIAIV